MEELGKKEEEMIKTLATNKTPIKDIAEMVREPQQTNDEP